MCEKKREDGFVGGQMRWVETLKKSPTLYLLPYELYAGQTDMVAKKFEAMRKRDLLKLMGNRAKCPQVVLDDMKDASYFTDKALRELSRPVDFARDAANGDFVFCMGYRVDGKLVEHYAVKIGDIVLHEADEDVVIPIYRVTRTAPPEYFKMLDVAGK